MCFLLILLLCILCVKHIPNKPPIWKLEEAIGCKNKQNYRFLRHLEDEYLKTRVDTVQEGLQTMREMLNSSYKNIGIRKYAPSNDLKLIRDFKGLRSFENHMKEEQIPKKVWKLVFEPIKNQDPCKWGRCLK